MKRAPFLGAGASLVLAGCGGGRSVLQMLPGATSSATRPSGKPAQLVPQVAEAIPDAVLMGPLMGEARRFDGTVAPERWMLAQGQTLNVADNRQLFSILGSIAGGDGKKTFNLPNPGFGLIIAVAGAFPTGPAFITQTQSIRKTTAEASLGPGAIPARPRMPMLPSREVLAARQLAASSQRAGGASAVPVSQGDEVRIAQVTGDARAAANARLTQGNRSRLAGLMQAVVEGRLALNDAVSEMSGALGGSESAALLAANDDMIGTYRGASVSSAHPNPQLEAARFLISVAFTKEQLQVMNQRESSF